ncbi:MAG: RNA polymerase sigma factor [Chitinophagales bacterium]|nr:RNA polymerase sigma factor [Bacteroidota bacterium]MCB9257262.1 RNA polymerase sigma factor [Chitinophagales bacterium]
MKFEEIFEAYWQRVFRLCMGYVNDYHLAQDLAQDSFVLVWQNLSNFREEAKLGTWIFRIASNRCLRQIENQSRNVNSSLPPHLIEEKQESIEPRIAFLYQCISELPEIDRIIISLELEDIKQAEIANILGLSEANVRVKIHRIKEKLTKKFRENGH